MTTCTRCHLTLPTAARSDICDYCDGLTDEPRTKPAPTRHLRVVHNAIIAKENGGLGE